MWNKVLRQSALLLLAGLTVKAAAYDPRQSDMLASETPKALVGIGITEQLGKSIDLNDTFVDDKGQAVSLGRYFNGKKPVLLTIVYYNCPSLCNFHLNGVTEALKELKWTVGREFELVAVSMDHREGPSVAGPKKANYVKAYGRPDSVDGWHFLTGTEAQVRALADQIGFAFRWNEEEKQFAHASAAVIATPEGKISRYIHGIQPDPKTLRLALLEASGGKIGGIVDRFVMFCYHFDPTKSRYTLAAWNVMRIGSIFMVLAMGVVLLPIWLREKRRQV